MGMTNVKKYNIKESISDDTSIIEPIENKKNGMMNKMRILLRQVWKNNKKKSQHQSCQEVNKKKLQKNKVRFCTIK
jgi:hypothetical protein